MPYEELYDEIKQIITNCLYVNVLPNTKLQFGTKYEIKGINNAAKSITDIIIEKQKGK